MTIQLENVTQRIQKKTVLHDINITFESPNVYGLQGKNGCGKTMLLRAIAGLIVPDEGIIRYDGQVLHKDFSFPPSIGVLIESPSFIRDLTGRQNLRLIASLQNTIDEEEIDRTLTAVGLDPDDKRPFRKYSLGMKQRLGIACAVMGSPRLVLLDEPVNAIDADGLLQIRALIADLKARGSLVILACHDKEELYALSDVIVEMKDGTICGETVLPPENS